MTADEARALLLVRHLERTGTAPWRPDEAERGTAEAAHGHGDAPAEARALRRAVWLVQRWNPADPRVHATLAATAVPAWALPLLLAVAAVVGLGIDRIGVDGRINILAPPVLALLLWNVLVYLWLIGRAVTRRSAAAPPQSAWPARLATWWRTRRRRAARGGAALAAFAAEWTAAATPLFAARAAAAVHLAAAVLAAATLASMYARGIAFEYRAGWDSTFLGAEAVHRIVTGVLGPASALGGIALPGPDALARLRFAEGSPGENAARWIHLYAITVLLAVVLPRLALAGVATWRARRLTRDFPFSIAAVDLRHLRFAGAPLAVPVLPYAYRTADTAHATLAARLADVLEHRVDPIVLDNLPLGTETLPALPDVDATAPLVLLFNLSATPEAEMHGAFVRAVRAHWPQRRVLALVDEAAFRARLGAQVAAARLEARRAAWTEVLSGLDAPPVFADLSPPVESGDA